MLAAAVAEMIMMLTTMMMMDNGTAIRQTCQISAGRRDLANSQSAMLNGSMHGGEHQSTQ